MTVTVGKNFGVDGDVLCIDFANTLHARSTRSPVERLSTYTDLLEFGLATGVLDESTGARLAVLANQRPLDAEAVRFAAIASREVIYRILRAIVEGESPAAADIDALNRAIAQAYERCKLQASGDRFIWGWQDEPLELERAIWPFIDTTRDFLLTGDLNRVRVCAAHDCQWLFYDTSRNRSRKWCDMTTCGNRAKVARYRGRHGETGEAGNRTREFRENSSS